MISKIFIDRPIVAMVIALFMIILGAVSIGFLCRASGNSQGTMRQQSGLGFRDDPALV